MKARAHVFVSGNVQGVFFRASARDTARRLGLTGWVKNLPDGRVEAVFEGERPDIARAVAWCREGPIGASVSSVEVSWEKYTGQFDSFNIAF